MRNRRNRFRLSKNIDTLTLVKRVLEILIIIFLLIFIFSSIKMKKNISKHKLLANSVNNIETDVNNLTNSNKESELNIEHTNSTDNIQNSESNSEPRSTKINMALTGDIMCHNTIYKDAYNSQTNSYDFSYIFEDIKYNIQTADITIR